MKRTTSQLIQTILALLFIFVFGNFIPTWSTVTRMGVQYLCIMVGWIWLSVLQGNLLLPSVVAMVGCLIPGYFTPESLVSATLGNTITVLMIFIFILVYIFQQSKTGDFLVRWLLSRKVVNGRPYLFTAFFLAGIIIIGSVIGSFGIILLAIAILGAICEVAGIEKTDNWVRFMLLSVVALSGVTEIMYPFKPYAVLILQLIPQGNAVYDLLNGVGQYFAMAFVVSILCLIRIDGEPICEINDVFKNGTNWSIIFAVGAVLAIGGAMSADESGVSDWLYSVFANLFGGMSPVTIIIIVAILGCFVTQFFSNSATAILFLTALAPLAVSLYQQGVNVSVLPPIIGIGTLTACLLPCGSGQSAIMLGTDIFAGDGQKWALSKGVLILVTVTIGIILAGVICISVL